MLFYFNVIFNFRKCDKLSTFNKYAIRYQHTMRHLVKEYDTIRYDTRCYFNVRLKANMSQLNLPHGTDN